MFMLLYKIYLLFLNQVKQVLFIVSRIHLNRINLLFQFYLDFLEYLLKVCHFLQVQIQINLSFLLVFV